MNFREYCESRGLDILRDDLKFIRVCLRMMPKNYRKSLLLLYVDKWLLGTAGEENVHLKQNSGRLAANSWLREVVVDNKEIIAN